MSEVAICLMFLAAVGSPFLFAFILVGGHWLGKQVWWWK